MKFPGKPAELYREALDCMGPIHLHGQPGLLPELSAPTAQGKVPFGGGQGGPTDGDCITAAQAIRIVHEPNPTDDAFMRARDAIGSARRVIFLGFGYAKNNVERLLLSECLDKQADVFLCTKGFTAAQLATHIRPQFNAWPRVEGQENQDIAEFFRHYPQALL